MQNSSKEPTPSKTQISSKTQTSSKAQTNSNLLRRTLDVEAPLALRLALALGMLALLLFISFVVTMAIGAVDVPLGVTASIVLQQMGIPLGATATDVQWSVISHVRLPRVLTAALVGAALALAGATMQGIFRNPLADPGIIGVSAGGALGAVIAIHFGIRSLHYLATPALAFLGALAAVMLVYVLAATRGVDPLTTMILAGVAVQAFIGSIISAVLTLTANVNSMREIVFWLTGSLGARSWTHVQLILPFIVVGSLLLLFFARDLNLMSLGEDTARSMGVDVRRVRLIMLTLAALITAVAVAVSGIIGFVGLVVPHMVRLIVGPDHRIVLPTSLLTGAVLLTWADFGSRLLLRPQELRVGLITAFFGAPFFLYLLYRSKRQGNIL
ncbi:MAG: iron ABC transporter permease [Chloroflexi bacterium]|nr:iron ABC transporter permease [Chloroflexota bacterium]